jgi:ACR3 family arsenite efflux pump ArsB
MLFATFLQVPFADLGRAFLRARFLGALLSTNFLVVPIFVNVLGRFLPDNPMVRLGVFIVLLSPCVDYVVTFSYLGGSNATLLLAATPTLLILQIVLLPFYLHQFLGNTSSEVLHAGPFLHAFVWLIATPVILAVFLQLWARRNPIGRRALTILECLAVPATAFVLFVVIAVVMPRFVTAPAEIWRVVPIYIVFAIVAPLIGWTVGRCFRLDHPASRAVAFSAGTRNSLVVLPFALAVPEGLPLLPAIIVTQTLVELLSELVYIKLIPKLTAAQRDFY